MNDPIPSPLRGRSVIDWAVPVTQRLNALSDKVGADARNERDRRPQAPLYPYIVRWAQSENDGDGAWIIWLADGQYDLYDGPDNPIPVTTGLTAASNYPTGWYIVPTPAATGEIWLNVKWSWSSSLNKWYIDEARINQSLSESDTTSSILIATVSRNSSTGSVEVEQLVVGALVLPPAFGNNEDDDPYTPPEGYGDSLPKPWDIENDDLVRRYFNVGGITFQWTNGAIANISQRVGYICLQIPAVGGNYVANASIITAAGLAALQAEQRDVMKYTIPLWHRDQNGNLTDLRCMPQIQLVEALI